MTSLYCLKAYKGGGDVGKSTSLRSRILWMVPLLVFETKHEHSWEKIGHDKIWKIN